LDSNLIFLSVSALDIGVLSLSGRESTLEGALSVVIAATSSSNVPSSITLILEVIAAEIAGSNTVDTSAEDHGDSSKNGSGLYVNGLGLEFFRVELLTKGGNENKVGNN
jgi:hypothetical protein